MGRVRLQHRCLECGAVAARWVGRCAACGAWNSLVEEVVEPSPLGDAGAGGAPAVWWGPDPGRVGPPRPLPLAEVDPADAGAVATGVGELDRVLGGGLVPGSVTLLGGEPGIGKSTLVLEVAAGVAHRERTVLLVAAEESAGQVRRRAERLGALAPSCYLLETGSVGSILAAAGELSPSLVVVDSVQAIADESLAAPPGSPHQVSECAQQLAHHAKTRGCSVLLVGHVTKDGVLAGPRALEHLVDTVLSFEGDRHHALRLLTAVKHRFGPAGELGLFEMKEDGLFGVGDPAALLLGDRPADGPGSIVVPLLAGHRPLLVELQALVGTSVSPSPRRVAEGVAPGRLGLVLAVLERRCGLRLGGLDVFAAAVGGVRVTEPGADLALSLALVSAVVGEPLPRALVACGEVGLAGEVRQVPATDRRLGEAARAGFRLAVVPASAPEPPPALEAIRVRSLAEALGALGLGSAAAGPRRPRAVLPATGS